MEYLFEIDRMDTATIKKEFSKTISKIRKDIGGEFPKAMMTSHQMAKSTATVNCGGEWRSAEKCASMAAQIMEDERFQAFLAKCNARAEIEISSFGRPQIRIHY